MDFVFNPRRAALEAEWSEVERQMEMYLSRWGQIAGQA
jgi:hypothetical protein